MSNRRRKSNTTVPIVMPNSRDPIFKLGHEVVELIARYLGGVK